MLSIYRRDDALHVEGECDMANAAQLLQAIDEHSAGRDTIRVDCSHLTFCDSHCWGCFLLAMRSGKRVVLVHPSQQVRRGAELMGVLDVLIEIED